MLGLSSVRQTVCPDLSLTTTTTQCEEQGQSQAFTRRLSFTVQKNNLGMDRSDRIAVLQGSGEYKQRADLTNRVAKLDIS